MNPGSCDARMTGSLSWAIALGVSMMVYSTPARSETCVLPAQHAGIIFPVEQIEAQWVCPLHSVMSSYTTVNKAGPIPIVLPEPIYRYLLDRPPMAAALINRLDLSLYKSEARGPGRFWCNDGAGTEGIVELVYQDPTNRIYYVEGTHTSTVLPDITGKAVVFIKMNPLQDAQGNDAVETTLVAYAKLDNPVLAGLMSLVRPLIGSTVARRLVRGLAVVNSLGQEMRQHPDRVLLEATDAPALPYEEVVFLKQALIHLSNVSGAIPSRSMSP
jgi:hypothetical protein